MNKSATPTVTVVIPYSSDHTPEWMLEEAIESVKNQSVPTKISVVHDEDNRGPAWARNKGINSSTTRFVAFLDADDRWKPRKLSRQLSNIRRQQVGLCIEGEEMNRDEFIRKAIQGLIRSITSSILIDTELVSAMFRTTLERYEDRLFVIEAAADSGVCLCDDLIKVRKHDEGLSARETKDMSAQSLFQMAEIIERDIPAACPYVKELRGLANYLEGRHYQLEGDHSKALKKFEVSLTNRKHYKTFGAIVISICGYIQGVIHKYSPNIINENE